MKDTPKPDNRRTYDAAFRIEALRLAAQGGIRDGPPGEQSSTLRRWSRP